MERKRIKGKRINVLGTLGLFITAIIWGSSFPVGKVALLHFSPIFIAMTRYLLGGTILGIVLNKKIFTITKKEILCGFICGTIFYFASLIQIIGLKYTEPSKQSFLAALYVIIVPFLYWMVYKKRPDIYNIAAAVLTLAGIYLLTVRSPGGFNKGDAITVISSAFYAVHLTAVGFLVKIMNPITLTFLQTTTAGMIGLAVSLFVEPLPARFPVEGICAVLYLTIFCTVIAYGLQMTCQKYVSEMKASIILSLESVVGTLLSVIFLQDTFTIVMFIGCVVIFIGVLVSETKLDIFSRKRKLD